MAKAPTAKAANASAVHLTFDKDSKRFNGDGTVTTYCFIETDSGFAESPQITVSQTATPTQIRNAMYTAAKTIIEANEPGTNMIPQGQCWFFNIPA